MFEKSDPDKQQEVAALNRRKPENRWRRILRDADWDQHETVRRWLKFARKAFDKDDEDSEPRPTLERDDDKKRAA